MRMLVNGAFFQRFPWQLHLFLPVFLHVGIPSEEQLESSGLEPPGLVMHICEEKGGCAFSGWRASWRFLVLEDR